MVNTSLKEISQHIDGARNHCDMYSKLRQLYGEE